MQMTNEQVKQNVLTKLSRYFGVSPAEATREQMYKACAMTVKDILSEKRNEYKQLVNKKGGKRVYYMCMEFLLGRSFKTNLCNLGLEKQYSDVLSSMGFNLNELYEQEPDAGLGNGGLGRLAACFMDSLSSLDYPATGFSILYEYGLFRQKLVDGLQVELPDVWLPGGEVWLVPRTDRTFKVRFGGKVREFWREDGRCEIVYEGAEEVEACANDMMISGADSEAVSLLRLWKARDIGGFDMSLFTQGQYMKAVEKSTNAEAICKVLYPSDNHVEGKMLRLTQQYFLTSASCQSIIRDHLAVYGTLDNLSEKVAIHINDTHPALCIPELMRIFLDDYCFSWERAWDTVTKIVSYTNHTVMPEALETWQEDLFKLKLPRIYGILCEINRRFCDDAWKKFGSFDKIGSMAIVAYNSIRMANLSVIASHTVNGVSALHSEILKKSCFKDLYKMYPEKFTNVTNGIAHRRWLCYSNPALAGLLDECIGTDYRKKPEMLRNFEKFKDDSAVKERLAKIKHSNKVSFSDLVFRKTGIKLNPDSVFDVQAKRLHEYKRQLLNAMRIVDLYCTLKENPNADIIPQTFIFGAKAAPGYDMAKQIIKLICYIANDINKNPKIAEKLQVVFLENYSVSLAESLMPAADISEQISLAGKEASGTGNMKFMINGAITVGTLDGANVEMLEEVGKDNIYIFGLTTEEVDDLWNRGYNAASYYHHNERLKRVVDAFNAGFCSESFANIYDYLLVGRGGISDPYMCLADFDSYMLTKDKVARDYLDKDKWQTMSLMNIASSGKFASDRSIEEYAKNIWHLEKITSEKN